MVSIMAQFEIIYGELTGWESTNAEEARWFSEFERCVWVLRSISGVYLSTFITRTLDAEIQKLYALKADNAASDDEKERRSVRDIFERINEARLQLEVSNMITSCCQWRD